jgi:predicted DsbA family dithiol-disulfide isomerase
MTGAQPGTLEVEIDIVSDVVCPWCVIGYKQLEHVLSDRSDGVEARIRWHAFELNPGMPEAGQNLREHLAQKAGITPQQSAQARQRLSELGSSLGFAFNFSDEMRIVNTFRAHQLLHWAAESGRQTDLKLALFAAYFSEGKDVSDPAVLLELVATCGLDAQEAASVLAEARMAHAVRAEERRWQEQELRSVPAFIFNGRYAVMGAQGEAAFERVLQRLQSVR